MSTPFLSYLQAAAPALQDAADGYSRNAVATAVASRDQQIATLQGQLSALQALEAKDATSLLAAQQQLASVQTQLASASANDATDQAALAANQRLIADLQAQLLALQPGKAPAPPTGYVEAFRDDMNGKLGPGWTVANATTANNELSMRMAANVIAAADRVSIVARRQMSGTRQFTSGYITTKDHASWPFFKALVRARWDDVFAIWPAVPWFRFDSAVGEIDGVEGVGGWRKLLHSAHQTNTGTLDHSGLEWPMPAGWSPSDYHIYGTERRRDGSIIWSVDDVQTFTVSPSMLSTQMRKPMTWLLGPEYAGPAHLIINLQVGGTLPNYYLNGGQPIDQAKILAPGTQAAQLDIDWVQVLTPLAAA